MSSSWDNTRHKILNKAICRHHHSTRETLVTYVSICINCSIYILMLKFIRQPDVNTFRKLNEMVPAMSEFQVSATMFILPGQCLSNFCLMYSSRRDQVHM